MFWAVAAVRCGGAGSSSGGRLTVAALGTACRRSSLSCCRPISSSLLIVRFWRARPPSPFYASFAHALAFKSSSFDRLFLARWSLPLKRPPILNLFQMKSMKVKGSLKNIMNKEFAHDEEL
jgi:hypothetical protein